MGTPLVWAAPGGIERARMRSLQISCQTKGARSVYQI